MTQAGETVHIVDAALAWHDAGCSVIPIRADGTKRAAEEWKARMVTPLDRGELSARFQASPQLGIGIVCGQVSGNLEMLELEGRAATGEDLTKILAECQVRCVEHIFEQLTSQGYAEWTPSGGLHFLYRISDHEVPRNTKIARRRATPEELAINPDDKIKVLSETRGEGGYVIVAPTAGAVHPSGDSWSTVAGQIGEIPTLTWEDRQRLVNAIAAALDQMPPEVSARPSLTSLMTPGGRPGDDFNQRADWTEILAPHGWGIHHRTNKEIYWTRPGKAKVDGWSATTGYANDADRLYVWSTSTVFEAEKPYTKFAVYTMLEHHGDYAAAARSLAARGFGDQAPTRYMAGTLPSAALAPISMGDTGTREVEVYTPGAVDRFGLPVYSCQELLAVAPDQLSLAQKWEHLHSNTFKYVSFQDVWIRWNGHVWEPDKGARHRLSIHTMLDRYLECAQNSPDESAAEAAKKARTLRTATFVRGVQFFAGDRPNISALPEDFDEHPNLLTCGNGTLDLATMQLSPHDPKQMLTRYVNANYEPSKCTGRFTQFMEEVLPDPQVRAYLQRACGYMLSGEASQRIMVMIHGETGCGKTQFLEAIYHVMGNFAAVAPASAFQPRQQGYKGPTEDLHKLMGKRFVMQSELDAGTKLNESLIKGVTGSDMQTTRDLYAKPVDWKPEYVVFMATNFLPRISSSDSAIWHRVKPIKFEQKFINADGDAFAPENRNLGTRMALQEPEVILNWMLEGLQAYREHGLAAPEQIGLWLREYRDDVDTTRQFLTEAPEDGRIKVQPDEQIGVRELYRIYASWCQDNEIRPVGMKTFNERLLSSGWKKEKREKGIMWQGIGATGWIASNQQPVLASKSWFERDG